MCDGMFTSHVNAIINICADLKEHYSIDRLKERGVEK